MTKYQFWNKEELQNLILLKIYYKMKNQFSLKCGKKINKRRIISKKQKAKKVFFDDIFKLTFVKNLKINNFKFY